MELSRWNRFELRAYRLLGVNQFRRIVFTFERIRHFKDKGKNENYHLANFDPFSLEQYEGFLIYNGFLHCVSLLFIAAYTVLSIATAFRSVVLDISMIALALLNLYCIMLQRANYLRLKEQCQKYYKRFLIRTDLCDKETMQKIYASEPQKIRADCEMLSRIRDAFEGKADCILTSADAESLKRICACFSPAATKGTGETRGSSFKMGVLEQCDATLRPYTALQLQADRLQRLLRVAGRKILARAAVITEDAECEALYKKLIPEDTAYYFCLVSFPLYETYTDIMGKVGTDEA